MEKQIKLDEKSAQEFVSAASRCNLILMYFITVLSLMQSRSSDFESGSDKDSDSKVLRRR